MDSISTLFQNGGPLMWPILATSLIGIALFLERAIALRKQNIIPPSLEREVFAHLQEKDLASASAAVRSSQTAFGRVTLSALKNRHLGHDKAKEAMSDSGSLALAHLERFLSTLATLASIAPLLGLLGTITGMIAVFSDIEEACEVEVTMLAGGIWEALITTGFGLIVAIPLVLGHRYLENRVDHMALLLEERSLLILDLLFADAKSDEA